MNNNNDNDVRERLSRLESKIDIIVKSVSDHLDRWDRQWLKIDDLHMRVYTLETEKKIWSRIISPIIGLSSGVVSSIITYFIISRIK